MNLAVGTILAKNYLPMARVLAASFRRFHPQTPFFAVLTDEPDGCFHSQREPFDEVLSLSDLGLPDLRRLCFRYSRQQLAVAAKPWLLAHLFDRGFTSAVFLDPDVLVLGDLSPLFAEVRRRRRAHAASLPPATADRELGVLQSGVFNGGFVGVSETPAARNFLARWRDRLWTHCQHDVPRGVYYDQRWLDLSYTLFEDVHAARDACDNVAYWNLLERDVQIEGDRVTVDGRPCRFFHFSGYDPQRRDAVSRHAPQLTMANIGPAAALYDRYGDLLEAAGHREAQAWPYSYGRFDNGVEIPNIARRTYGELGDAAARFGDPFAAEAAGSFFEWLNDGVDGEPNPRLLVSRLWRAVYDLRPDVRRHFPDLLGANREGYLAWTVSSGLREHAISDRFLPQSQAASMASVS